MSVRPRRLDPILEQETNIDTGKSTVVQVTSADVKDLGKTIIETEDDIDISKDILTKNE